MLDVWVHANKLATISSVTHCFEYYIELKRTALQNVSLIESVSNSSSLIRINLYKSWNAMIESCLSTHRVAHDALSLILLREYKFYYFSPNTNKIKINMAQWGCYYTEATPLDPLLKATTKDIW